MAIGSASLLTPSSWAVSDLVSYAAIALLVSWVGAREQHAGQVERPDAAELET